MTRKPAYLTIDDGLGPGFRDQTHFLREKGVSAIWFCTGAMLERHADDAIHAIRLGHVLGNHSYDHPHFSRLTLDEARHQIERTDQLIEQAYAEADESRPYKAFRFPYLDNGGEDEDGATDWHDEHVASLQELLGDLGYDQPRFDGINYRWWRERGFDRCKNVDCTFDTMDWVLEADESSSGPYSDLESVLGRMDEDVPEGGRGLNDSGSSDIVMMHGFIGVENFRALVDKLQSKGLDFRLPDVR